ncbi:ergosterol biosynthetic protein 28-like [Lolium rigidum]|uniref:ergosterol biosynthetic protein 28-like n=1 Tax=Lolium rigidum TaxID=89674 RepID=UPI001F5C7313|nr:ergosterol biosynthetic protein 28-like [Lolium rigidum]
MGVAVAGRKLAALPALGWWLVVVGAVRLGFAWSGFFDARAVRAGTYSGTHVTDVHGRTVGVWTLLSCTLCFMCAFNLENRPLCAATLLSFVYAYGHFIVEYLVYRTITAASLGTLGFFAVPSIIWTIFHWRNALGHHRAATKQS